MEDQNISLGVPSLTPSANPLAMVENPPIMDPKLLSIVFGGQSAPPQDPGIGLRVKIAKSRAERLERKRQIDQATMPFVQEQIVKNEAQQVDLQSKIDEALNMLKAPPPVAQTGFSEAELLAGGLGALIAPESTPDMLNVLAAISGARNERETDDKLRAYGLTRETAMTGLRMLMNQQGRVQGIGDDLAKEQRSLGYQSQQREQEIEDDYQNDLMALEQLEMKRGWDLSDKREELAKQKEVELAKIAAEKEKDIAAAGKERLRVLEQRSDNLRSEIISHVASYGGNIPPDLYADLQARRNRLVEEGAPDVPSMPKNNTPTKAQKEADENQKYREDEARDRKERYKQEDRKWGMKGLAEGWLIGDVDNYRPNMQFKDKKDRGGKIAKMTGEIDKARKEVDELKNSAFTPNPDPVKGAEEQRDRGNKLQAALRREWQAVRTKRLLSGGQEIRFEDYMKERYPELIGFWQGLAGAIKDFQIQSDGKSAKPLKFTIDDVPVTIREKK